MKGFLVRVGIDSSSGGWNAPVDERGRFLFVPIPDCPYNPSGEYVDGGRETFKDVLPDLEGFANEYANKSADSKKYFELPKKLETAAMHMDPDFGHLTYGDSRRRGKPLIDMDKGDFLAFYAGLRSVSSGALIYALIGMLEVGGKPKWGKSEIEKMTDKERLCNAHSRWKSLCQDDKDVILKGAGSGSGLFDRCVEIGDQDKENHQYYVREDILRQWGGFKERKDGQPRSRNIQRSGNLPEFACPEKFMTWFAAQKIKMSRTRYRFSLS